MNNTPQTHHAVSQLTQPDPAQTVATAALAAAPAASALPAPPALTRWQTLDKIVEATIVRCFLLGVQCGAAYGALCGFLVSGMAGSLVLMAIPFGIVVGLVIGAIAGVLLGVGVGLVLTLVTISLFRPLHSWKPYGQIMGAVGAITAAMPPLALAALLGPRALASSEAAMFLLVPSLISCVCAWRASLLAAERYAASMQISNGRLVVDQTVDIYHPDFQRQLFEQLQRSYRWVVLLTSLGMLSRWRRQLVTLMDLPADGQICDLISGTGELWPQLLAHLGPHGRLVAVEPTPLAQQARRQLHALADPRVELLEADVLHTGLPDRSVNAVTCAFGAMLIDPARIGLLADEIARILDDHGVVGLLDLSLPEPAVLRWPYRFYLRWAVPMAGMLCGADPKQYSLLARMVDQTSVTPQLEYLLTQRGFQLHRYQLSGGCASALVGMKIRPTA